MRNRLVWPFERESASSWCVFCFSLSGEPYRATHSGSEVCANYSETVGLNFVFWHLAIRECFLFHWCPLNYRFYFMYIKFICPVTIAFNSQTERDWGSHSRDISQSTLKNLSAFPNACASSFFLEAWYCKATWYHRPMTQNFFDHPECLARDPQILEIFRN